MNTQEPTRSACNAAAVAVRLLSRRMFVLSIAFGAAMACAQVPRSAEPAPAPSPPPSPAAIVAALKSGGYIVYFRHTATDFSKNDEKMRDFDDCANQRPLTEAGREQARAIGAAWRSLKLPVGRVRASP
ncbi:MAG: hypothetical protein ABI854_01510 [Betaproteobacteria bacterium]